MQKQILIAVCLLLCLVTKAQVSSDDRRFFAEQLNIRREEHVGAAPYGPHFLQAPFDHDHIVCKGVFAVSNKFMVDAYSNIDIRIFANIFELLKSDNTVFNNFIFRIFLYCKGDKSTTISLLDNFCNDTPLATRIYNEYWAVNKNKVKAQLAQMPSDYYYGGDNNETSTSSQPVALPETVTTFNIPIKEDEDEPSTRKLKDEGVTKIEFSTNTIRFKNLEKGKDVDTFIKWNITITNDLIRISSGENSGHDYTVVNSAFDFVEDAWKFTLGIPGEKHSVLHHEPKITHVVYLWYANNGYKVAFYSIDWQENEIFENQLIVLDKKVKK